MTMDIGIEGRDGEKFGTIPDKSRLSSKSPSSPFNLRNTPPNLRNSPLAKVKKSPSKQKLRMSSSMHKINLKKSPSLEQ